MSIFFFRAVSILVLLVFLLWYKFREKKLDWAPSKVSGLLQSWIDGDIDYKHWTEFEEKKMSDPMLEEIRLKTMEYVSLGSEYIESAYPNEKLTEGGKEKFRDLKRKCDQVGLK